MNPVVHFELPYRDSARAVAFYETVFGWKTRQLGPDMGNYVLVTTAEKDVRSDYPKGAINGGLFPIKPDEPAQYPSIVIGVPDISSTMIQINRNGGEVLGEPMLIPGTGLYVSFFDTEGNRLSILQPESV